MAMGEEHTFDPRQNIERKKEAEHLQRRSHTWIHRKSGPEFRTGSRVINADGDRMRPEEEAARRWSQTWAGGRDLTHSLGFYPELFLLLPVVFVTPAAEPTEGRPGRERESVWVWTRMCVLTCLQQTILRKRLFVLLPVWQQLQTSCSLWLQWISWSNANLLVGEKTKIFKNRNDFKFFSTMCC